MKTDNPTSALVYTLANERKELYQILIDMVSDYGQRRTKLINSRIKEIDLEFKSLIKYE